MECGACSPLWVVGRLPGTSPVDYRPEETKRMAVRRLGRRLLLDQPRDWDAVLAERSVPC
jgi:hypothetical protein